MNALDWFREFNSFWVAGVLPIFIAYFAWRSLKVKTEADNRERRKRYERENRLDEFSDDTVIDWLKKRRE